MALLTADDVLNKTFVSTKFREGYDQDEVDDFLDTVVTTLRELQSEHERLTAQLAEAEAETARLREAAAAAPAVAAAEPVVEQAPAPAPEPVFAPAPAAPAHGSEPESATGMLMLAQKLHDDYVRTGQEEGERLVAEARGQAARIVKEAEDTSARTLAKLEQERSLLERTIDDLRIFERDYRTRLKSYLENLLGDLDSRGSASSRPGQDSSGL